MENQKRGKPREKKHTSETLSVGLQLLTKGAVFGLQLEKQGFD